MSHPHGCVSWNIDFKVFFYFGMSHPHGCVSWNWFTLDFIYFTFLVTPSRVCELKFKMVDSGTRIVPCHTLTGVWVEISIFVGVRSWSSSHPHGCVSWNLTKFSLFSIILSHPHGCVSWNFIFLKGGLLCVSHPHGCVSWNDRFVIIEFNYDVTPSRVCELKLL